MHHGFQICVCDKPVSGPKARVVVRGDMQWTKSPSSATYSPTPSATEIRILVSLAAQNAWGLHSMDISQAFVQADPLDPDTHFYVSPPMIVLPGRSGNFASLSTASRAPLRHGLRP